MSVSWNPWHGCTKLSEGCANCYMFRRDALYGKDSTVVTKTSSFFLPVSRNQHGQYKIPSGETVFTCFTSDFFHPSADEWRKEAWHMMKERSDLKFYFITKRPDRFFVSLPDDWGDGYENVTICCTCENQKRTDQRMPVFLSLPIRHKEIIHEPMLEAINITPYLEQYRREIECVSAGGESGEGKGIRSLDYNWVLYTKEQCDTYRVPFHFHQTGTYFRYHGRMYTIPRAQQQRQALKAGISTD